MLSSVYCKGIGRRTAGSWTIKETDIPINGTFSWDFGWHVWNWWWDAYKPFPSSSWNSSWGKSFYLFNSSLLLLPSAHYAHMYRIWTQVTAATCSFMVFFSATMSACQYLLLGMEHAEVAVGFALICFVASMLGLVVVQKAIRDYGRASLIIFSVSIVMALSTVLMTTFGALNVLRDYTAGNPMGFKSPCWNNFSLWCGSL